MMAHLSDEELYSQILQCQQQEEAFSILYYRHSGPLFRFVYRFTGNSQSSEEILHDVFTQLLNGKCRLTPETQLKSWLYTVAKNKGLNHLKQRSRECSDDELSEQLASEENLESLAINDDLIAQLFKAIKKLPQDLAHTWQLRHQGLDNQQIAKALSIPLGTVKSRFYRMIEILKKELSDET